MHTYEGKSARFHFNGDMSGKIEIIGCDANGLYSNIYVDSEDIFELVAMHIVNERISKLEQMKYKDVLGLK